MPSLSSDFYSVDTVQVQDITRAFLSGKIACGELTASSDLAQLPPAWGDCLLNCALVSATVLACILTLRQLIEILPYLTRGIGRAKALLNLEDNMRLGKERDNVSLVSVFVVVLFVSRYEFLPPELVGSFAPDIRTLVLIALAFAFIILRSILVKVLCPSRKGMDYYKVANKFLRDTLILLAISMAITAGGAALVALEELSVKRILLYETYLACGIFAIRKINLSLNFCNLFEAILYLCALEILPASLLISALLLF